MSVESIGRYVEYVKRAVSSALVGVEEYVHKLLVALLAEGHVLMEGLPGIAKTSMVRALVKSLGIEMQGKIELGGAVHRAWSRIQCTPDLMPSDIVGSLVFDVKTGTFYPSFGPIFASVVLVDEINRALPRTQSALLQAMQEGEVTLGDRTYRLVDRQRGKFFFVLATQNPVEQEGTYPLPEAQLDRFLMRVIVEEPRERALIMDILKVHSAGDVDPVETVPRVLRGGIDVTFMQMAVAREVAVSDDALDYASSLIYYSSPRNAPDLRGILQTGLSPRAGVHVLKAAKAYAASLGKSEVTRGDIDAVFFDVVNHRVAIVPEKMAERFMAASEKGVPHHEARYALIREVVNIIRRYA